jgi:hypothetical protein
MIRKLADDPAGPEQVACLAPVIFGDTVFIKMP